MNNRSDFDKNPLERISERVAAVGDIHDPATSRPLLTLDEFFDGNDVIGSIGCNLIPTPTPAQFFEQLKSIAERQDVHDVRVQITMFDAPEWPFSDTVWVITSAAPEEVIDWFDGPFRPDECRAGWPDGIGIESYPVPSDMKPIACWWN
jgi:hypothetical protein